MQNGKAELFRARLYGEFQAFKAAVLSGTNAEIFDRCYEIDTFVNLYEMLGERSDDLKDEELNALMERSGILRPLYDEWLKKEDSRWNELEDHVSDEIRRIMRKRSGERRAA